MGLFDTHAHLYDKAFDRDRDQLIPALFKSLDYIVIPSEDLETSRKAVALAETYDPLYAAVGIHPQVTKDASEEILRKIGDLALSHPKVKAIGEIGLDYYYLYTDKEIQKEWFARQIELAKDLNLPFLIHDREAHGDTLSILKEHKSPAMRGILHCFSGSLETAKELIRLGFYISFAGPVVFPRSIRLKEVAAALPLERILIETDSPYLTPPPNRGKRNDPSNVYYVAEELARLKKLPVEEIISRTRENAIRIYDI
jgi:TatD DNase family protein